MKKFLFLLLAAVLVGSACFIVLYWVFPIDKEECISLSVISALTGVITAYLTPYFVKLEKEQKESIERRVRRNLKHQRALKE